MLEHIHRPGAEPDRPESRYPGYAPGRTRITAGTRLRPDAAPVAADLVFDRDVPVVLRDGTTIYTDVYRPADVEGPLPAIVVWSPYGKRDGFITFDDFPFRAGVPQYALSGLEKFEGPDPSWWCPRGYAIVQPDARGAYRSEGDMAVWDRQEGRDGADVVEWVGTQDWCTGKVGMAGTSWLAIAQWFVAAERPVHLAAIAPWEGLDDAYRFSFVDGGIPSAAFVDWLLSKAASEHGIEDVAAELDRNPEPDALWAAKRAAVEQIAVPVFAAASWGGALHCRGAFEGWHRLRTDQRWLQVYDASEWPQFADTRAQEDLRRFFDHYLAGIDNGWEATPRVRLDVCDFAATDVARAETQFPAARAVDHTLTLQPDGHLEAEPDPSAPTTTISADAEGATVFEATVAEHTEVHGYPRLHLWLSADGNDDADIFVKLRVLSADGAPLGRVLIPRDGAAPDAQWHQVEAFATGPGRGGFCYDGPWGRLRASRRGWTTDPREEPRYTSERKLAPGEVVELVITLTPVAMLLHPGDRLELTVAGRNLTPFPFPGRAPLQLRNTGRHVLHLGGEQQSRLVLPVAGALHLTPTPADAAPADFPAGTSPTPPPQDHPQGPAQRQETH